MNSKDRLNNSERFMHEIPRIQPLSALVVSQIAAGEVIERPASVVKELLENALDAQATELNVCIEQGGIGCIRVQDNGIGIYPEDLPLAVTNHATSKIRVLTDLTQTTSLGFRGEALASISAISRVELTSRHHLSAEAWTLSVVAGDIIQQSPAARAPGTTVVVKDLFFNTPVRRKFLHSEKSEQLRIETVLKRFMLSHPLLRWSVTIQGRKRWQLSPATDEIQQEKRLAKLLGQEFLQHALRVECAVDDLQLSGWITLPTLKRRQNDGQYLYVNQRFVKDKVLLHAIKQAYADYLEPTEQPSFVLFLSINPNQIDVNVHPAKIEVRFRQARYVHDFIYHRLSQILAEPSQSILADFPAFKQKSGQANQPIKSYAPSLRTKAPFDVIGLWRKQFLLVDAKEQLWILDMEEIRRHLDYMAWQEVPKDQALTRWPLVIPESLSLHSEIVQTLQAHDPILKDLGLDMQYLSETHMVVREMAKPFAHQNLAQLLASLSSILMNHKLDRTQKWQVLIKQCAEQLCYPPMDLDAYQASFYHWQQLGSPSRSFRQKPCQLIVQVDHQNESLKLDA